MIEADVENSHSENGYHYAYINNIVKIDGEEFGVCVAIRKKIASNQFWIHNIDEKNFELLSPSSKMVLKETQSFIIKRYHI